METRHTCTICKHWTDSDEKIKVHIEWCHVSPVAIVSRISADSVSKNNKNIEAINSGYKQKVYRDIKVKGEGKSVEVESTVGKTTFIEEEEMNRRINIGDEICRRKDSEEETSIMRDSIGYNLFDDIEFIDVNDCKMDANEDVDFVTNKVKDSVQPLIDLPPSISKKTSTMYCLGKEEDTFLHTNLLTPPVGKDQMR